MAPNVLLALTEPTDADRARSALVAAGFEAAPIDETSWSRPEGERPLAVLLDGRFPDGRSFRSCLGLRSGPWADVPVLWLGEAEDELAALSVGATVFLDLPLDEKELVAHVEALAASPESRAQLEAGLERFRARELDVAVDELQGASEGLLGAWGRYFAGTARIERGEQQVAAEDLHALLEEQPDFWRAHLQLARLYRDAGFEYEARRHVEEARALNANLPEELPPPRPLPELALPVPPGDLRASGLFGGDGETREPDDGRPLVLLADDSELALAMIGAHLESAGYRVVTAGDGEEALRRAQESRPDLVVLDGLMPGLNGFETCSRLKRELYPDNPPPVLMLSAVYTKQRQRTEAVDAYGADDLVPKTTDDAPLLAAARRLCPPGTA